MIPPALFEHLFRDGNLAQILIDPASHAILDANRAAEFFYGYDRETLLAMTIDQMNTLPHEQIAAEIAAVERGERDHFRFRHRTRGAERDVEVFSTRIDGPDGPILHSIIRDSTSRRADETARNDILSELTIILENAPLGIAMERGGLLTRANDRLASLMGWPLEDFHDLPITTFFLSTADYGIFHRKSTPLFREGRSYHGEQTLKRKDGTALLCRIYGKPIDPGNLVAGTIWIVEDITGQRWTEWQLRRSRDILSAITRLQSRFISDHDAKTLFQGLLTDLLGLTGAKIGLVAELVQGQSGEAKLVAHAMTDLTDPQGAIISGMEFDNFESLLGRVITSGEPIISDAPASDPRAGGLPPGHPPLENFLGCPLFIGKTVVGMVAMANRPGGFTDEMARNLEPVLAACGTVVDAYRNLQRRVEAEEHLEVRARELERTNAELEQFAYIASHDLQEPLRMITSYTQLLARRYRGKLDQDADTFISYAVEGAVRMQTLINDLLAYSRSNALSVTEVDLNLVFKEVLNDLGPAMSECGAAITADTLPRICADHTQMSQLLLNLIGNGVKYRKAGRTPRIHVKAQRDGAFWRISVADNGIGIEPKYLQRIFVIFQRLHTRESYPGTGIGLSLCKKIVEKHGGAITVESVPDHGSTFVFTLPAT